MVEGVLADFVVEDLTTRIVFMKNLIYLSKCILSPLCCKTHGKNLKNLFTVKNKKMMKFQADNIQQKENYNSPCWSSDRSGGWEERVWCFRGELRSNYCSRQPMIRSKAYFCINLQVVLFNVVF